MYKCLITLSKVHSGMALCQHEKMIPVRRIDRDEKRRLSLIFVLSLSSVSLKVCIIQLKEN